MYIILLNTRISILTHVVVHKYTVIIIFLFFPLPEILYELYEFIQRCVKMGLVDCDHIFFFLQLFHLIWTGDLHIKMYASTPFFFTAQYSIV